jgi:glutamate-1-semialdehyde aminotransferase
MKEHEAEMKAMRQRNDAEQKATIEKHEAAMQAMKEAMLVMELQHAKELNEVVERGKEEISAAMQAFESKVAARRVYHEAPNDMFELILAESIDADEYLYRHGSLNVLRLVSKRCLRVVESVATRLTRKGFAESLPVAALKRSPRI